MVTPKNNGNACAAATRKIHAPTIIMIFFLKSYWLLVTRWYSIPIWVAKWRKKQIRNNKIKKPKNESKRKHKLTLKTTINFRFCLLIVQVNEMIFMSSLCVSSNSKSSKTTFFARILWLSIKGIILRKTQLFACFANILRVSCLSLKLFSYFCKRIYLFYNNVWQRKM